MSVVVNQGGVFRGLPPENAYKFYNYAQGSGLYEGLSRALSLIETLAINLSRLEAYSFCDEADALIFDEEETAHNFLLWFDAAKTVRFFLAFSTAQNLLFSEQVVQEDIDRVLNSADMGLVKKIALPDASVQDLYIAFMDLYMGCFLFVRSAALDISESDELAGLRAIFSDPKFADQLAEAIKILGLPDFPRFGEDLELNQRLYDIGLESLEGVDFDLSFERLKPPRGFQ